MFWETLPLALSPGNTGTALLTLNLGFQQTPGRYEDHQLGRDADRHGDVLRGGALCWVTGGGRAPCWAVGWRAGTELGAPSGRGSVLAPGGRSSPGGPELRSWSLLLLQAQWKDEVQPLSFRFRL